MKFIILFVLSTLTGAELNECATDNGGCSHDCVDTGASYYCQCPQGFQLGADLFTCEDIDECRLNTDRCLSPCLNYYGNCICACPDGEYHSNPNPMDFNEEFWFGVDMVNWLRETEHSGTISHSDYEWFGQTSAQENGYTLCAALVDECVDNNGDCSHECVDTVESFYCLCPEGFDIGADGKTCVDIDECALGIDGCRSPCLNYRGGYICGCADGLQHTNADGRDVDVWFGSDFVIWLHEAANAMGVPSDVSKIGQSAAQENGMVCVDIDECVEDDPCDSPCLNYHGGYVCGCAAGYRSTNDEEGDNLALWFGDDLVSLASGVDPLPEDFNSQAQVSAQSLGLACGDIDECSNGTHTCAADDMTCQNSEGSYQCLCASGFRPDDSNTVCVDIDECVEEDPCDSPCLDYHGGYVCGCAAGYRSTNNNLSDHPALWFGVDFFETAERPNAPGANFDSKAQRAAEWRGLICEDIDECAESTDVCVGGVCQNASGSYQCICDPGLRLTASNTCVDIDECVEEDPCDSPCLNYHGGYVCGCAAGYRSTNDEEDDDPARWFGVEFVAKAEQSHSVALPEDFDLQAQLSADFHGLVCEDVDECAEVPDACADGMICENESGWYACMCDAGFVFEMRQNGQDVGDDVGDWLRMEMGEVGPRADYYGEVLGNDDGTLIFPSEVRIMCVDVDECAEQTDVCASDMTCENKEGSYQCVCPSGFRLDEGSSYCVDIDECVEGTDTCGAGFTCENLEGSYECLCPSGFEPNTDNTACNDIDECRDGVDGRNPCPTSRKPCCRNTSGGYQCRSSSCWGFSCFWCPSGSGRYPVV